MNSEEKTFDLEQIMIYLERKKKLIGVRLRALFTDRKIVLLEVKRKKMKQHFTTHSYHDKNYIYFLKYEKNKTTQWRKFLVNNTILL